MATSTSSARPEVGNPGVIGAEPASRTWAQREYIAELKTVDKGHIAQLPGAQPTESLSKLSEEQSKKTFEPQWPTPATSDISTMPTFEWRAQEMLS